ncbi:MBL fold metallo-hydrolase [Alicyclobacillus acidiphilus]|uniref:MBL fold metallo-hydrolase n=1 Tax=Alicyclobacillus acidiphilus TaxID=182455 RepID=UPI000B199395|nr:MBL fold metallo-hydrolase [Alicyclobacillus acidiphilus]
MDNPTESMDHNLSMEHNLSNQTVADEDVLPDVTYVQSRIANVVFIGPPHAGDGEWVMIDAGMAGTEQQLLRRIEERFERSRPGCIILTHGHFDHVGTLIPLAHRFDVPVYAHPLELPYLTGRKDYRPPDPTVGGGMVSYLSVFFPRRGLDLGDAVRALPPNGEVPHLPEWRWIHTPGHTEGHISLFRERDRALVAGDAFTTVKQESLYAVLSQKREIHGPPAYFTTDWQQAKASVRTLQALKPAWAVTGHGRPMFGTELDESLERLAADFDWMAKPDAGKYVH